MTTKLKKRLYIMSEEPTVANKLIPFQKDEQHC